MSYLKDKGYNPVVIGIDLFLRFLKVGKKTPMWLIYGVMWAIFLGYAVASVALM